MNTNTVSRCAVGLSSEMTAPLLWSQLAVVSQSEGLLLDFFFFLINALNCVLKIMFRTLPNSVP